MYMLYSSQLIICIMSGIPTGIYNNVHALFFSPYHMFHGMYATGIYNNVHPLFF